MVYLSRLYFTDLLWILESSICTWTDATQYAISSIFYVYDNHTYTQQELTFPNLQGVQVSVHFLHVAHSDEFYLK